MFKGLRKLNKQAKIHLFFLVFWLLMIPVSIVTGWIGAGVFIGALSLYAIVVGHWSAFEAAIAGKDVVEAMVEDPRIPTKSE